MWLTEALALFRRPMAGQTYLRVFLRVERARMSNQ
jgi:hypothetical protein